jgi:hypothetical protein
LKIYMLKVKTNWNNGCCLQERNSIDICLTIPTIKIVEYGGWTKVDFRYYDVSYHQKKQHINF